MGPSEKIAAIKNEIEALCLKEELEGRGIPHIVHSNYDSSFDGLFQFSGGWGHVEAPAEYRDEILAVLEEIRQRAAEPSDAPEEDEQPESG